VHNSREAATRAKAVCFGSSSKMRLCGSARSCRISTRNPAQTLLRFRTLEVCQLRDDWLQVSFLDAFAPCQNPPTSLRSEAPRPGPEDAQKHRGEELVKKQPAVASTSAGLSWGSAFCNLSTIYARVV
jgi:hypothetical protein